MCALRLGLRFAGPRGGLRNLLLFLRSPVALLVVVQVVAAVLLVVVLAGVLLVVHVLAGTDPADPIGARTARPRYWDMPCGGGWPTVQPTKVARGRCCASR